MYWVWFFLYCTQPVLLLLGLFGLFGDEGKRAAEDVAEIWGIILLILIAGIAIYLGFDYVGLI